MSIDDDLVQFFEQSAHAVPDQGFTKRTLNRLVVRIKLPTWITAVSGCIGFGILLWQIARSNLEWTPTVLVPAVGVSLFVVIETLFILYGYRTLGFHRHARHAPPER